jgi:PPOX class probable F420-dependent enzyme
MPEPHATRPYMPGYGLKAESAGLLPWSWARQRLEKSHNYFLSTVSPDGSPHCMPVWGLWLNETFYFSTGRQSKKARNLAHDPRCVLCTDNPAEAVIVEGTAALDPDPKALKRIAPAYNDKYHYGDVGEMDEPVYVVTPRVAFGMVEGSMVKTATRWTFKPA